MNEAQTEFEYIDPALRAAGWDVVEGSKIYKQFPITQGRILGKKRRAQPLKADYVLQYKNRRLAVIEAKKRDAYYTEGVGQAKDYSDRLNVRYAFATNGKKIYSIDMQEGVEGDITRYPSPDELWEMTYPTPQEDYKKEIANWKERFDDVPYPRFKGKYLPRYYQYNAIEKVLDGVAEKKDRLLLTMATGTGKTATAFHICWKLFHAKWNLKRDASRSPRILFLADRNLLADQAFNSFGDFEEDALVRIKPADIKKKGKVPTNGNIFFTIFQSFMSGSTGSPNTENSSQTTVEPKGEPTLEDFEEVKLIEDAYGYMYILQCADKSFYVGSTKDLERRLSQHQEGDGAKYTKSNLPVKLVYYETFERIDKAFQREKQIEKWSHAKKAALVKGDIESLISLSKNHNKRAIEPAETFAEPAEAFAEPAEAYFGQYPSDFFDFIIIDECHRGGANDESSWRAIMDYFSPAVQLGLTATPKRDVNGDTYDYFGEPVYTYALKEGINDGFLTPFKVKQIQTTIDTYKFEGGDDIEAGNIQEDREYLESDFNRVIEIPEREQYRIRLFMDMINQNQKTLVFCATQEHAAGVRDYINQYADSKSPNYCHRVTADDGGIGEKHLEYFQDNEKTIPTILTTSQKLSTGVDAPEIRNIVLLRPVNSMVEFKQIVGRGTRLFEGKDYFTIYDFVKAHEHFNDPEWDGEPLDPPEPSAPRGPKMPCIKCGQLPCVCEGAGEVCPECANDPCVCDSEPEEIIRVKLADNKVRELDNMVKTTFWSPTGQPISSSQFIEQLFGDIPNFFKDEQELRKLWSMPGTRKKLLEELGEKGYSQSQLDDLRKLVHGEDSDLFDVLSYVAYHKELVPRLERAEKAKVHFDDYNPKQQEFLNFVLEQYVKEGFEELDDSKLPDLLELKYNAIADAKSELGDIKSIRETFIGFQGHLYG